MVKFAIYNSKMKKKRDEETIQCHLIMMGEENGQKMKAIQKKSGT